MSERYRNYDIGVASYSPAPQFDYEYAHVDFDGADDANDNRYGRGRSVEDCKAQIDDLEDDMSEPASGIFDIADILE